MDELARAVKLDPLEFRVKNLKDERLRAVLEAAAKSFGLTNAGKSPGRGYGIACGIEKGGRVATASKFAIAAQLSIICLKLPSIAAPWSTRIAEESGFGIVMALGGALAIEFAKGRISTPLRLSRAALQRRAAH
jgi:isoquinoline 1-oxidoreductase